MNRVSTAFAFQAASNDLLRSQARQVEAQTQLSSGKRATDLKGFGRDAQTLISAQTVQARALGFVEGHKLLGGKLSAQNLALERLGEAADGARQLVINSLATGRAESLMKNLDSMFGQAVDALNWKHEGRHLFAGSQVDVEPVTVESLAELVAAPSVASVFVNDQVGTESRLNESTRLETSFVADALGTELFEIMEAIQVFNDTNVDGPMVGELTADQEVFLEGKLKELTDAHTNVLARVAENGLMQQRVEDARDAQQERATLIEGFIADIAEVDVAEAFTRLEQSKLALQASAQALTALRDSSLLNLLRGQ